MDDAGLSAPQGHDGRGRRRIWPWVVLSCVTVALIGGFWLTRTQMGPSGIRTVSYTVPPAPRLVAAEGERVYRIQSGRSTVTYTVDERIVGRSAGRTSGSTGAVAGDIAFNAANPSASRVGDIVVDVEELHSDNSLRDARIRGAFLSSHANPLAVLSVDRIAGLPDHVVDGQTYTFTLYGSLRAHARTVPVVWQTSGSVAADGLRIEATASVTMSSLGVGPISIAGLLSTGDPVTLHVSLLAVDPARSTPVALPVVASSHGSGGPSFARDVAPVLAANCASCHHSGQVGAQHWTLDTARDAARVADGLAVVTKAGYMPPWPASGVGLPLAHSRALDPKSVAVLERWADAGGRLDVAPTTPVVATPGPAGPEPRVDVSLAMPEAYTGDARVPNDYRCFVLDPGFAAPTFVTGYSVTPDHRQEIHHAQIFHIDATQAAEGSARSGFDGRPGWECYAGPGLKAAASQSPKRASLHSGLAGQPGLIAGWVPGQDPVIYPEHSGVLFQPGDALVLQIHYHYDQAPVPDRSRLTLQTAPGTEAVKPLMIVNPIGPVEIPCMPGVHAPLCDRDAALADAARQYGPSGSFVEPGLLLLCHKTVDELTAGFTGVSSSSCDTKVPASGRILGSMGHMHTLGKSFRLTLDPQSAAPKVLLDIPVWNFDWQMNYQLATPLHVDAGQTIRMECSWDRSVDPNRAEKYIIFAEGTEDEMCFSTYALIPDGS